MDNKIFLYTVIGIFIIGLVIVICVVTKKNKHAIQRWYNDGLVSYVGGTNQIGLSAYPPSVDPGAYGDGTVWLYAKSGGKISYKVENQLKKWFEFADRLGPDLSGTIYDLFPDLQTKDSIYYYGLSLGMVRVLDTIVSMLDNIRNLDDIKKYLEPVAIKIFDENINEKPLDGLYSNIKDFDYMIDVL